MRLVRDEDRANIMLDLLNILGLSAQDVADNYKKLAAAMMGYTFDLEETDKAHIDIWLQIKHTKAKTYWMLQCLKQYGYGSVIKLLDLGPDEQTELMAKVLGARDGMA